MEDRSWWQRALERFGVHVHPDVPHHYDHDAAAAGRYIFVYNDSESTMEAVTTWLQRSFDLDAVNAAATMMRDHRHGYGVVGPFEPAEAERRMDDARGVAADLDPRQTRLLTRAASAILVSCSTFSL